MIEHWGNQSIASKPLEVTRRNALRCARLARLSCCLDQSLVGRDRRARQISEFESRARARLRAQVGILPVAVLLPPLSQDVMCTRADVAQLVEQRFRKPHVTGSNPVVGSSPEGFRGCHAVASAEAGRMIPSNFFASYGLEDARFRIMGSNN